MSQVAERRADEITVGETLTLLDTQFPGLLRAVAEGTYVFWLGSGISREHVEDLPALVARILRYLQQHIDSSDPGCRYRRAFYDALDLAALSDVEKAYSDLSRDISEWEIFDDIVRRLCGRYAQLLDISILGEPEDFILWNVVDVATTYGSVATKPGLEHYCLAVLILEGVLPDIVSANWDGLVERAVSDLAGEEDSILAVRVCSEDFREPNARSRILKFHGCAVRAKNEEGLYRSLLVGRRSQITEWSHDAAHEVMRQEMINLAATRRTLMMGLSAQDTNIQELFASAKERFSWPWPTVPAAFVFAEEAMGIDQQNILRVSYRSSYKGHESEIESRAHLRAFAKPLLAAFVLGVLTIKLQLLAQAACPASQDAALVERILEGLSTVSHLAADNIGKHPDLILGTIANIGRMLSVFREGCLPVERKLSYTPIGKVSVNQIVDDSALRQGGTPRLALAISLFGQGHAQANWTLTSDTDAGEPNAAFCVESDGRRSRVFFAASGEVALQLELNGLISDRDASVVVVHCAKCAPPRQRSPQSAPGRTGRRTARHIDMAEVTESVADADELMQRFREQVAL